MTARRARLKALVDQGDTGAAAALALNEDPTRFLSTIQVGITTIGILSAESDEGANEWLDHVVVTGIGHARNLAVAASGDAVIAVGGSWGTLAEIGFAMRLGRPTVILEPGWKIEGVPRAASPLEAVEAVLGLVDR